MCKSGIDCLVIDIAMVKLQCVYSRLVNTEHYPNVTLVIYVTTNRTRDTDRRLTETESERESETETDCMNRIEKSQITVNTVLHKYTSCHQLTESESRSHL